jgi:hypothetical protein
MRSSLGGLPQRLVQDGVVDESGMHAALEAAAKSKTSFVTQLIAGGTVKARDIAITAAAEYGVPLFDLDSLSVDLEAVRTVSDKLLAKHRVLPLFKRGKRLFLGVADPTNLHAIDEIKFQTSLAVEAIVVEDDKLQRKLDKAIEQFDTQMPNLGDDEAVARLRATMSRMPRSCASSTRCCWTRFAAAPRTCTSSRTRRCFACACAWTASSRRLRSPRYSSLARSRRA